MKANELRIGNYIQSMCFVFGLNQWREWKVTSEDLVNIENNNPDNYKGISLTEEWSAKFGFPDLIELAIFICNNSKFKNIEITSEDLKDLKVHELQNLTHALTGSELEIKETVTP